MHVEFLFKPIYCNGWPEICILLNGNEVYKNTVSDKSTLVEFTGVVFDTLNVMEIHYTNKTEWHTITNDNNEIVDDQTLTIEKCYVDNMLLHDWFITDGYYEPNYFPGYIQQHKDQKSNYPLVETLKSELTWHFPGKYVIMFEMPFWEWYHSQHFKHRTFKNMDKDTERWEKFVGIPNMHEDLVDEIMALIDDG